jgi:hypothetical protein
MINDSHSVALKILYLKKKKKGLNTFYFSFAKFIPSIIYISYLLLPSIIFSLYYLSLIIFSLYYYSLSQNYFFNIFLFIIILSWYYIFLYIIQYIQPLSSCYFKHFIHYFFNYLVKEYVSKKDLTMYFFTGTEELSHVSMVNS